MLHLRCCAAGIGALVLLADLVYDMAANTLLYNLMYAGLV